MDSQNSLSFPEELSFYTQTPSFRALVPDEGMKQTSLSDGTVVLTSASSNNKMIRYASGLTIKIMDRSCVMSATDGSFFFGAPDSIWLRID